MASRLSQINFITENPSISAFNSAVKNSQAYDANDEELKSKKLKNELDSKALPSRLRNIEAGADSSVAGATVDKATVPYKIESQRSSSRVGTVGADVAEETKPNKIQDARSHTRLKDIEVDTAEQTQPDKISASRSGARSQAAAATNAELTSFYKVLDTLNGGDVEGARSIAAAAGWELPQDAITDTQWRQQVSGVAARAKELYPNRPLDQQVYIEAQISEMRKLQQHAAKIDPAARYATPPGAPLPPETSAKEGAVRDPADVRTAEWLMQKGVAADATQAWTMVKSAKADPERAYREIYNNVLRSTGRYGEPDTAKARAAADEFMRVIQMRGAQPAAAPAAPGPTPSPAPAFRPAPLQPERMSPGNGTAPQPIVPPPLPPALTGQGAAYSPSRRMWRTSDGRMFDEQGNPVAQ